MKTLLALLALFLILQSCDLIVSPDKPNPKESKEQLKDINTSGKYSKIEIKGAANVYIKKGAKHKVELRGKKSHFSYVIMKTHGKTLVCDTYDGLPRRFDVDILITMPDISDIKLSGAGQIELSSFNKLDDLDIDLSGAGSFETKGQPTHVSELDISISGAGSVEALDLIAENVEVSVSGAGSAEVHATKKLDASVSGVGSIEYEGNPKVRKSVSGIGSISKN